jgi:hypothetical protein
MAVMAQYLGSFRFFALELVSNQPVCANEGGLGTFEASAPEFIGDILRDFVEHSMQSYVSFANAEFMRKKFRFQVLSVVNHPLSNARARGGYGRRA